jgi:hypothetical protein
MKERTDEYFRRSVAFGKKKVVKSRVVKVSKNKVPRVPKDKVSRVPKVIVKVPRIVKPLTKKCSMELINKFNIVASTPYNKETRKYFKEVVSDLEYDIKDAKKKLGIISSNISDTERRMRRLVFFSKHLKEKPCLIENGTIAVVRENNDVLNLDTKNTAPYEYFAEGFDICKRNKISRILIPIGIKNKLKRTGDSRHSNLVVVDISEKKAWRIEPNEVDKKNQNLFENILSDFFGKLGIKFEGFYPSSCPIKHGGLCKYVVYAQYLYGDKITYENLKDIVIQFLKDEVQSLCEL